MPIYEGPRQSTPSWQWSRSEVLAITVRFRLGLFEGNAGAGPRWLIPRMHPLEQL